MKSILNFSLFISAVVLLVSCNKNDKLSEIELVIPSRYELENNVTTASAFRIDTNGTTLLEITHDEYIQNVGGFEGYLLTDLIDSMQNSYQPAQTVHIKSNQILDILGYKILGEELDFPDLNYSIQSNIIKVNHEIFDDLFLLDIKIVSETMVQINYIAYQYTKNSINLQRSPLFFDQIEQDNTMRNIAEAVLIMEELEGGDYIMVIKGEYFYEL